MQFLVLKRLKLNTTLLYSLIYKGNKHVEEPKTIKVIYLPEQLGHQTEVIKSLR